MGNKLVCAYLLPWIVLHGLLGLLDECNQRGIERNRVLCPIPFCWAMPLAVFVDSYPSSGKTYFKPKGHNYCCWFFKHFL